jgi:hypothetical protein
MIPDELKLVLKPGPLLCCSPGYVALELSIINVSGHDASIIVPGQPALGLHLFEIQVHDRTPETMKWTLVKSLTPTGADWVDKHKPYELFWHLRAGDTFRQVLLVPRYTGTIPSYSVLYRPHISNLFPYAFAVYNEEGEPLDTNQLRNNPRLLKSMGSFSSNLCTVPGTSLAPPPATGKTSRSIMQQRWGRLQRQLRHGHTMPVGWPVLNNQLYSQTVNMSLPTFSTHSYMVDTRSGPVSIQLGYKLGTIYRGRSRLASLAHMLGIHHIWWKTSNANTCRLMRLDELK